MSQNPPAHHNDKKRQLDDDGIAFGEPPTKRHKNNNNKTITKPLSVDAYWDQPLSPIKSGADDNKKDNNNNKGSDGNASDDEDEDLTPAQILGQLQDIKPIEMDKSGSSVSKAVMPYHLLTHGFIRDIAVNNIPTAIKCKCEQFVYERISDGDFYIDPPRLLFGKLTWNGQHIRDPKCIEKVEPKQLVYLNFNEFLKIYEDRFDLYGNYVLKPFPTGFQFQYSLGEKGDNAYFFFPVQYDTFFNNNLCFKERKCFSGQSSDSKKSQLFIIQSNEYYERNKIDDQCPICNEKMEIKQKEILWCGHAFHDQCLFKDQQKYPNLMNNYQFKCYVCGLISK